MRALCPPMCQRVLTLLLMYCTWSAAFEHDLCEPLSGDSPATVTTARGATRDSQVPDVLTSIFVTATFHWDVLRLVHLHQALEYMMKYPTKIEVHIITESRQKLVAAGQHWQFPLGFEACSFDQAHNDNHNFSIAWEHRHHLRLAFESDQYTMYIHLEADVAIPWSALTPWAMDTALLAPHGFQRGFFVVEFSVQEGEAVMVNEVSPLNLTRQEDSQRTSLTIGSRHFACLPVSYNAFTLYSHDHLRDFLHSGLYYREDAMTLSHRERPGEIGERLWTLGYPERAAGGLSYFKVPEGFSSSMLVPYDASSMQLDMVAAIWHLTNRYAADSPQTGPASVKVSEYLRT